MPSPVAQLVAEGVPNAMTQQLLSVWDKLTPEDQETGVAMLRTLWEQRKTRDQRRSEQSPS